MGHSIQSNQKYIIKTITANPEVKLDAPIQVHLNGYGSISKSY